MYLITLEKLNNVESKQYFDGLIFVNAIDDSCLFKEKIQALKSFVNAKNLLNKYKCKYVLKLDKVLNNNIITKQTITK